MPSCLRQAWAVAMSGRFLFPLNFSQTNSAYIILSSNASWNTACNHLVSQRQRAVCNFELRLIFGLSIGCLDAVGGHGKSECWQYLNIQIWKSGGFQVLGRSTGMICATGKISGTSKPRLKLWAKERHTLPCRGTASENRIPNCWLCHYIRQNRQNKWAKGKPYLHISSLGKSVHRDRFHATWKNMKSKESWVETSHQVTTGNILTEISLHFQSSFSPTTTKKTRITTCYQT